MKYEAIVYKKVWYCAKATIEANSLEEAIETAKDEAGTYDYELDGDCEFVVDDVQQQA